MARVPPEMYDPFPTTRGNQTASVLALAREPGAHRTAHIPQVALRASVKRLARHLGHALDIALIAQRKDPEWAAQFISDALHVLEPDLARVIAAAKTIKPD